MTSFLLSLSPSFSPRFPPSILASFLGAHQMIEEDLWNAHRDKYDLGFLCLFVFEKGFSV